MVAWLSNVPNLITCVRMSSGGKIYLKREFAMPNILYFRTGSNGSGIKQVSVFRSKQSILPVYLVCQSGNVGPVLVLWSAVSSALLQKKNTLKMLVFSFCNKIYI